VTPRAVGVEEADQQLAQGALSRAAHPDEGNALAGLEAKAHVLEDGTAVSAVAEGDVFGGEGARAARVLGP
jgi:hypothetical protein